MQTAYGKVHCTMKGVPKGNQPTILTFHDIGLNGKNLPYTFLFIFSLYVRLFHKLFSNNGETSASSTALKTSPLCLTSHLYSVLMD